jgi:hypothetical protein
MEGFGRASLPILLAALGCSNAETVAPSEPATAALDTREVASNAPFILRGAIITPNGVLKHGYVGSHVGPSARGRRR